MLERYEDALREYAAALESNGHDPAILSAYAAAAVGGGRVDEAKSRIDSLRTATDRSDDLNARWILAVAARDWTTASQVQKSLEPIEGIRAAWWRRIQLLRIQGDPSVDNAIAAATQKPQLREFAESAHVERLLDDGEFSKAASLAVQNAKELGPASSATLLAYAAGGLLMHGEAQSATRILDDAVKTLQSVPESRERRITGALIAGLRGSMPLASVMAIARDNDSLPHAWFVAAVRAGLAHDHAGAADALTHCMKTASGFDFPYLEAKSLKDAM
jgi:hypothetical protein